MASKRDSDSLDDLFDFGDDDALPPPIVAGPRKAPAPPPRPAPPEPEDDGDRTTALPPMPQPEYVQTMMERGEEADPSEAFRGGPGRRQPVPLKTTPPKRPGADTANMAKLGLVMASEEELLGGLEDGGPARVAPAPPVKAGKPAPPRPAPPIRRPTPAVISMRATPAVVGPARVPPRPPRPSAPALPTPRAPSIPPGTYDPDDPLAELDALAAAFDQPPEAKKTAPGTSMRQSRTPSSGGLRILRPAASPASTVGGRVTPVGDPAPASEPDRVREMQARFTAKNYGGALVLAEAVLAATPDHAIAKQTAESCRELIGQKYLASLGGREGIPRVAMSAADMRAEALDHRAGFLVSLIDGSMTIEEVIDVSAMAELDALRIMFELRQQGVIEIQEPPKRRR